MDVEQRIATHSLEAGAVSDPAVDRTCHFDRPALLGGVREQWPPGLRSLQGQSSAERSTARRQNEVRPPRRDRRSCAAARTCRAPISSLATSATLTARAGVAWFHLVAHRPGAAPPSASRGRGCAAATVHPRATPLDASSGRARGSASPPLAFRCRFMARASGTALHRARPIAGSRLNVSCRRDRPAGQLQSREAPRGRMRAQAANRCLATAPDLRPPSTGRIALGRPRRSRLQELRPQAR